MIRYMEPYRSMYDKSQDEFQHWLFIVLPCAGVTLLTIAVNGDSDWMDVLWNFSIYLESVAILPQLWALRRYREVENLTGHYIFFLGAYRFFYILNWVWRSYNEEYETRRASRVSLILASDKLRPLSLARYYRHNFIAYGAGALQSALYADFAYYYIIAKARRGARARAEIAARRARSRRPARRRLPFAPAVLRHARHAARGRCRVKQNVPPRWGGVGAPPRSRPRRRWPTGVGVWIGCV